jgi:hypothetical protein
LAHIPRPGSPVALDTAPNWICFALRHRVTLCAQSNEKISLAGRFTFSTVARTSSFAGKGTPTTIHSFAEY